MSQTYTIYNLISDIVLSNPVLRGGSASFNELTITGVPAIINANGSDMTIPNVGGASSFVMTSGNQDISGQKTFSSFAIGNVVNYTTISAGVPAPPNTISLPVASGKVQLSQRLLMNAWSSQIGYPNPQPTGPLIAQTNNNRIVFLTGGDYLITMVGMCTNAADDINFTFSTSVANNLTMTPTGGINSITIFAHAVVAGENLFINATGGTTAFNAGCVVVQSLDVSTQP
jgi:hypothetical protein